MDPGADGNTGSTVERRRRRSVCLSSWVLVALGAFDAVGSAPAELPNLAADPPFHVVVGETDDGKDEALRFSLYVSNRGAWPLDLESRPPGPDTSRSQAWQCTSWTTTRVCVARRPAGTLRWHEAHGHFHFLDFAEYELRRLVAGRVDWSARGVVARQRKVSYCLTNGPRDPSTEEDPFGPNPAYVCGGWVGLQGISPGYADIYDWKLPGQFVPLGEVPNGRYALTVRLNVNRSLKETDRRDNKAAIGIVLMGRPGDRRISRFALP